MRLLLRRLSHVLERRLPRLRGSPCYGRLLYPGLREGAGLDFCGQCQHFPCDTIMTRPHVTVLDKDWLAWKKRSEKNGE